MPRPLDPLVRLLLGAALCLPLCLGLWWWFVRNPLAQLLGHTVGFLSPWFWPETVLGIGLGRALAWAMQRASLGEGLGALLLCSGGVAAFALVNALGGSGFIAVYLVGLVVGLGAGVVA